MDCFPVSMQDTPVPEQPRAYVEAAQPPLVQTTWASQKCVPSGPISIPPLQTMPAPTNPLSVPQTPPVQTPLFVRVFTQVDAQPVQPERTQFVSSSTQIPREQL